MPLTSTPLSRKPGHSGALSSWPSHLGGLLWSAASDGATAGGAHGGPGHAPNLLPSGHPRIDAALVGGGWPGHALIEALQPRGLHAEWRLLLPAVRALQSRGAHVILIAPPFTPFLPGLTRLGLNPDRIAWVQGHSPREVWWAMEQALKCQALTAVLGWCPDPEPAATRRLQLAATLHDGLCCLFRPASVATQASAAPLRLLLRPCPQPGEIQAKILKQRGRPASDWLPMLAAQAMQPGWAGLLNGAVQPQQVDTPRPSRPTAPPPSISSPGALDALLDRLAHS